MKKSFKASIVGLIGNIFLFIIKLIFGLLSNSIALLSDAANSFLDIVASSAIMYSVKISSKAADKSHPFGHRRAEPIASMIIAIFAGILGFEVIISSIRRFLSPEFVYIKPLTVLVVITVIIIKIFMFFYFKKNSKDSPAIAASAIDARNDIFSSSIVLIAVISSYYSIQYVDSLTGVLIGFFIIKSGYGIAMQNIDFLMGRTPDKLILDEINMAIGRMKLGGKVKYIKAHYVGNFIHVALTLVVDKKTPTKKSHDLSEKLEDELEKIHSIDHAFVHVDYK